MGSWKWQVKKPLWHLTSLSSYVLHPSSHPKSSFPQGSADFRSHNFVPWAWKKIKKTNGMVYWVEYCPPPQIHVHRESAKVTLLGNRVFVDVIKMKSLWMRVGPKFNGRHTQREHSHANNSRDLEQCTYKTETPKSSGNHQKLGRGKEGLSPGVFRETMTLLTPWIQTSSLQNCERIHLCCFKLSSLW